MPKKVGTENWRKKRRQEYLEMKEFRYYIFCEGEQASFFIASFLFQFDNLRKKMQQKF